MFIVALCFRLQSYDQRQVASTAPSSVTNTPAALSTQYPRVIESTGTVMEIPSATAPARLSDNFWNRQDSEPAQTTPLAPANTPAVTPSLFSRIVAPIVQAISGSAPKSKPAIAKTAPASTSPSSSAASNDHSSRGSQQQNSRENEKDTSSDTTAPQLVTIEFVPPQVRDGEETALVVQAIDDLSGIRSISGTISAPSGAIQGFACQREGDTNRFVSRILVPKDAAEGVWQMSYLSMIDNASNAAGLTRGQGSLPPSASFRVVSSRPDSQGPALKAVWLDRRGIRAGEKNTVFVEADDDKSGLNLISGIFQSPSKFARVGFVCKSSTSGTWECEFSSPTCGDCGEWQLEQVQLQDKANNMTTVRGDNPIVAGVRMDIMSDHCDAAPPTLQGVMLDRDNVVNTIDTSITVSATISDDICGVLNVSGQATGPSTGGVPPRLYFSFAAAGDSQTWTGRLIIPKLAAKGVWRISWIQVLDRGHNLKTYSAGEPALSRAMFNVQ